MQQFVQLKTRTAIQAAISAYAFRLHLGMAIGRHLRECGGISDGDVFNDFMDYIAARHGLVSLFMEPIAPCWTSPWACYASG